MESLGTATTPNYFNCTTSPNYLHCLEPLYPKMKKVSFSFAPLYQWPSTDLNSPEYTDFYNRRKVRIKNTTWGLRIHMPHKVMRVKVQEGRLWSIGPETISVTDPSGKLLCSTKLVERKFFDLSLARDHILTATYASKVNFSNRYDYHLYKDLMVQQRDFETQRVVSEYSPAISSLNSIDNHETKMVFLGGFRQSSQNTSLTLADSRTQQLCLRIIMPQVGHEMHVYENKVGVTFKHEKNLKVFDFCMPRCVYASFNVPESLCGSAEEEENSECMVDDFDRYIESFALTTNEVVGVTHSGCLVKWNLDTEEKLFHRTTDESGHKDLMISDSVVAVSSTEQEKIDLYDLAKFDRISTFASKSSGAFLEYADEVLAQADDTYINTWNFRENLEKI